jgi:2,4-dienoyl-CoA reductase-like NADH-dependent reductase (Old Yellow Enzyme family)
MQQINRFIIGQNSVPGIQLAHAGRKASAAPWEGGKKLDPAHGVETVAPSAIDFMMMRRR